MLIENAHQNNLKKINLDIPENQLIAVTGLSGSGKSSLAMDVIANEGYRYFLESLPAFNQQNGESIPTAEVDEIIGLPPVIKVEQSKRFQSIKATFGTLSELTATFRIIFARYSGEGIMSKSPFSFNHPRGACERCHGIGMEEYIDLDKLIGDKDKSLREGAIVTTLPNGYITYSQVTVEELNKVCNEHGFSVNIPWKELSTQQKDVVLNGSEQIKVFYGKHSLESRLRWEGLKAKPREEGYYKGILPIMKDILKRDRNKNILKFVSSRLCSSCKGARIKREYLNFKWEGFNFQEWMEFPLRDLINRFQGLELSTGESMLVDKINVKLLDLINLGMEDFSLNTPSEEISSGDAQRIKLINQVNSNLQGILYVFDEPSIGLSKNFQIYLFHIFRRLIGKGNTVMVVEHDLDFLKTADWIIELGPGAGLHGGEVVFNGPTSKFLNSKIPSSPTLTEIKESPEFEKNPKLETINSFQPHDGKLTVIKRKTGLAIAKLSHYCKEKNLKLEFVSDQPIGKTPRSNPATYTGLADRIRDLLAKTREAERLKLSKSAFSFNNKRGRCETCEGAGVITLSMNLMGSVNQICPTCNGKRFKPEVLKVHFNNKSIAEIYQLSVEEAIEFFSEEKKLSSVLAIMVQLGLGYLKLGQPSNTLSGGEAQRIKLTKYFAKKSSDSLLVLEHPSLGLHHKNVRQLLGALHALKKQTAGIICFENHNLFKVGVDVLVNNSLPAQHLELKESQKISLNTIKIRGAKTHHLKDLNIDLPRNQLSVITGISGSGKSSLVIDTLHGYGQQEMSKQFSTYHQSRVGVNFQLEVDHIEGLSPTICVTRKERSFTRRSDVAKQTGIDKILRFAFSRKAQYVGEDLSASHFSNNHELGKCAVCDGYGEELLPDPDKIVLDADKSVSEGLFEHNKSLAYYGQLGSQYMAILKELGKEYGFSLETPFKELTAEQRDILFNGSGETEWKTKWEFKTRTRKGSQEVRMKWKGLFNLLKEEYYKTRNNKNIENLTALFSPAVCSNCSGSGLKPERLGFKIGNSSIHEIMSMDFQKLEDWLAANDDLEEIDKELLSRIKPQIINTINRGKQLHIDHLQLNRKSTSLSGGENQRVALIKQLNSPLKGITYLLDEPSAGLSMENIPDLIDILNDLIQKGNTVIVIEHNKEIIQASHYLVEIGPQAGKLGGKIVFRGTPSNYAREEHCHPYLRSRKPFLGLERGKQYIVIKELARHGLIKNLLEIPVGGLTAISGRSGVGKTSLVKDVIIPGIQTGKPVFCEEIEFPMAYEGAHYFETQKLKAYSNTLLVSYLDLLNEISKVFASNSELKPKEFSYKHKSSQCSNCKGRGYLETSLDIVANVTERCDVCQGRRYKEHILDQRVNNMNIAEVLSLDLKDLKNWLEKFKVSAKTNFHLESLVEIGLGHLSLEQPVRSLSSGEKQRLLLLNWLEKGLKDQLLILDEPSTGLHYEDIDLLFEVLKKLSKNNDILVIDHNPYLLKKIGIGMILS